MSKESARQIVAVAWYSPTTWAALRQVVVDPDTLEASYEAWCGVFERGVRTVAEAGVDAVCVPIDLEGYVAWCAKEHHALDSGGRAGYAAELLRRQHIGMGDKRGA
jgi:hypothetical protein